MHNIDRNMLEFGHEGETFESEQFEWPQGEAAFSQNEGWFGEYQGESEGEGEWGFEVFSEITTKSCVVSQLLVTALCDVSGYVLQAL